MSETGKVRIHGREYKTVALRVSEFREACPATDGWCIVTSLLKHDNERVIIHAAIIKDGITVATGLAEETRGSSQINKTSALENCETSAIGRALAAFGLGGSEYASANEVVNAIHQQKQPAPTLSEADKQLVDKRTKEIAGADTPAALTLVGQLLRNDNAAVQNAIRPVYAKRQLELQKVIPA